MGSKCEDVDGVIDKEQGQNPRPNSRLTRTTHSFGMLILNMNFDQIRARANESIWICYIFHNHI